MTVTPTPTTTIGFGYRSGIDQKIDGRLTCCQTNALFAASPLPTCGSINTTIKLPDIVSLGLRQRFGAQLDATRHGRMVELEPYRHVTTIINQVVRRLLLGSR